MAQSKGFKQFPFKWRAAWLALGRANPRAAYVWDYMFWRSDKDDIFDLEESLVCKDTGLERKTLCKARSLIAKHGGLKRVYSRNPQGQLIVKYQMLGFEAQVPENGTDDKSQETGSVPSPSLRDSVKRDHTVDTPSVDTSNQVPVAEGENEGGNEASPTLAPLATAQLSVEPSPNEKRVLKALALPADPKVLNDLRLVYDNIQNYNSIIRYWEWNQSHQPDRFVFYSLSQVLASLTKGQKRGFIKFMNHERHTRPCPVCKKLDGGKERRIVEFDSGTKSSCLDCEDNSCDSCLSWLEDHPDYKPEAVPPLPQTPQNEVKEFLKAQVFEVECLVCNEVIDRQTGRCEHCAKARKEAQGPRKTIREIMAEPRQAFEIEEDLG